MHARTLFDPIGLAAVAVGFIAAVAAASTAPGQTPPDARLPTPPAAEQSAALAKIRQIFSTE